MGWIKDKSQYQSVDGFNDELNNLTSLNNIYEETYGATLIIDFLVACQGYVDYGKLNGLPVVYYKDSLSCKK